MRLVSGLMIAVGELMLEAEREKVWLYDILNRAKAMITLQNITIQHIKMG